MKSVTLLTTGQPTTNPRLIKEAEKLTALGYRVKVIYCFYQQWAKEFDAGIIGKNSGMYIICGGDPENDKLRYYITRARQKLCQLLAKYIKRFQIPECAISRTHAEALTIARKLKSDLYIAHNLGALPAAVMAAKYNNAKVGYDAEDMHSGQFTSSDDGIYMLNKYIEEKYFNQTDYFTVASPLIGENYRRVYPFLNPVVINNVFPAVDLNISQHYKGSGPLKLFWFSQTIGADRGLETVLTAMANCSPNVQLHLLGKGSTADKHMLLELARENNLGDDQLHFHTPVSPGSLLNFAAGFDIGIASETASTLNRDICLTNKIFTYVQCGLAILASDTQAQTRFMNEHPAAGKLYKKNDAESLAACINFYAEHPDVLYQTRLANYNLGQADLNWEHESEVFMNVINTTLN